MRITQERLKKIIREEFTRMTEIEHEEGEMGSPKPVGAAVNPDMPHTAVHGAKSAPEPAGAVDVRGQLELLKQALIKGGTAEDQYLSSILQVVAALIAGTNIATDSHALRALKILQGRAQTM